MTDLTDAEPLESLMGRMRGIGFFLLDMRPTEAWAEALGTDAHTALLHQHLLWLDGMERAGHLVMSGPVDLEAWDGRGLSVVRAAHRSEVEALSAAEPFAAAGLRANQVHSWTVNEGRVQVTVDLFADHATIS